MDDNSRPETIGGLHKRARALFAYVPDPWGRRMAVAYLLGWMDAHDLTRDGGDKADSTGGPGDCSLEG
jgi:hypothetical protein